MEGKERLVGFSKWLDDKLWQIGVAKKELGPEKMKEIESRLRNKAGKTSAIENKQLEEVFLMTTMTGKHRYIDPNNLADITPWMDGSIILSYLTGTNKAREYLMAELIERKIKCPKKWPRKKKGKHHEIVVKSWDDLNETELRHLIRRHEKARLITEEGKAITKEEDVKCIKPLSAKMQQWFVRQGEIYKEKKGLT